MIDQIQPDRERGVASPTSVDEKPPPAATWFQVVIHVFWRLKPSLRWIVLCIVGALGLVGAVWSRLPEKTRERIADRAFSAKSPHSESATFERASMISSGPSAPIEVAAASVSGVGTVSPAACTHLVPCASLIRGATLNIRLTRRGYAVAFLQDRWGKFYNQEGRPMVVDLVEGDSGLWPGTDKEIAHPDFKLWVVTSEEAISVSADSTALERLPLGKNGHEWGPVYLRVGPRP